MRNALKRIFVTFSVLSVVAWSGGAMALANEAMLTENAQDNEKIVAGEVVKEIPEQTSTSSVTPEFVHGEWCSALIGMISSPILQDNEVIDTYSTSTGDGVVDLDDVITATQWYGAGDNTACRARFDDTFTEDNYLNIDWCAGLVKGVTDSYNTSRGNARFSEIFDVYEMGDSFGVIDLSDLSLATSYTDQATCYAHYEFAEWPSEEPVVPGEWCSLLRGIVSEAINDHSNDTVADLDDDGMVDDDDLVIMSQWYGSGLNNEDCRGRFYNPEPTLNFNQDNYTDINWCQGLLQGVTDSYNSQTEEPRYSSLFDIYGDDGKIDLSDLVLATQAVSVNDQSACYQFFVPPFTAWTCPVIEHASGYNAFPACGATGCESGYHLDNASCVADSNSTPSNGGGGGGGGGIQAFNIFNVQNSVANNSANVTWQTNRMSLTWMLYGTSTAYGSEYQGANYHTAHTLALADLSPATLYHYQIRAKDNSGNTVYDIDRTFTTPGGTLPPQVLGVKEEACKFDVDGDIQSVMQFITGSLIRACGPEVYHVLGNEIYHVPNWQYLHDNYFAQRIYNVSPEVVAQYIHTTTDNKSIRGNGAKVSGTKLYADGTLLKANNGKIYVIVNGKKVHIATLEELKKYSGNKMYTVTDAVLNQY